MYHVRSFLLKSEKRINRLYFIKKVRSRLMLQFYRGLYDFRKLHNFFNDAHEVINNKYKYVHKY